MSYPIQAADVCIYCINWGFRIPAREMGAEGRPEIGDEYGPWLAQLHFKGQGSRHGRVYDTYGILYVPDPYTAREA